MSSHPTDETIPMRPDERIDPETLGAYLVGKIPGVKGPPEIVQFPGGKANLTYMLRYPGHEYVLRRPPLGPIALNAHDMGRESRVLMRLNERFPLAPRAFHYCEDTSLIGAPFFVMERREGIVIREEFPTKFHGQPALYRRMSEMMVDVLVELHAVDADAIGLGDLGRPKGFVERQITGWYKRWEGAKTEDVARLDSLRDWLMERIPETQRTCLLHNDYRLDNMMVDGDDPATCVAVFDWDMCTRGDPLVDLGTLLGYWTEPGDSEARRSLGYMPTAQPGFYTREELAARYAEKSGLDLSHILFYELFAVYKLVVVMQQIFIRYHRGQTQDARFKDYARRGMTTLDIAWDIVQRWPYG